MKSSVKFACLAAILCVAVSRVVAQTAEIDISKNAVTVDGQMKPIPVTLSGFSGEVDKVVRYDLWIAGFEFVSDNTAQFEISGSNTDRVEGRVSDRVSKASLLAKAYSGSSQRALAHAFADDVVKAITGRRGISQTKIAYKQEIGGNSEIFMSDYDGFGAVQLTKDATIVAAPAWLPGQRGLLYTSYRMGNPDIYSHDLSTGARKVVARFSGLNTSAAVSPDGRKVAMILSKAGSPDVYVADIDGSNLRQLTQTREDESSPCWSPDGSTICFVSRLSGRPALYTIPAAGGTIKRLTVVGVSNVTEPDWSPDGKSIVFTALMGDFNICTVPAAGGNATILTLGEDPSWAPNSRTVVFTRRTRGKSVLSLLDAPTKRVKDVQQLSGSSSQPNWAK